MVNAFSTLRGTSSLDKPVMGLKVRYFGLVSAFSPLRVTVSLGRSAFSPLRAMFSLGKSVFCLCEGRFRFASPSRHVFTRFRVVIPHLLRRFRSVNALTVFERRFRSVNALSLLKAAYIALRGLSFRPVIVFSLYGRVFAR